MSGPKTRPCSAIPFVPAAHAPPGNKATASSSLSGGSARLLSVLQTAPFHSATRALKWPGVGTVEPTARALLGDRAATSPKPPGTGGKSSRERWPLAPAAGALAMGKVVQEVPITARPVDPPRSWGRDGRSGRSCGGERRGHRRVWLPRLAPV